MHTTDQFVAAFEILKICHQVVITF